MGCARLGMAVDSTPGRGPLSLTDGEGKRTAWLLVALCLALAGCAFGRGQPDPDIAVLLSDNSPAFAGVLREIEKNYPSPVVTRVLGDDEDINPAVLEKIQSSRQTTVVAIGLRAARAARELSGKKVIFCQVFNYEAEDLVTPWMKGVAATAPTRELFRAWKTLYPGLRRVGVITGKGLHELMEQATAAARENGIELVHVVVRSDKETLYAYKRLMPKMQGLWLVPDNHVLSRDVIRDVMAHSVKEGRQVAVFGRELLSLGGLVSTETDYADIAGQVLTRVRRAERSAGVPGQPVIPLTRAVIKINTVMAKRLNLKLRASLRGMAYAP